MRIERSLGKSLLAVAAYYLLKIGRGSAAAFSARKTAVLPLFAGDEKKQRCAAAEKAAVCRCRKSSGAFTAAVLITDPLVYYCFYFDNIFAIYKRSTRASQEKNQLYSPIFRTNKLPRSIKYRGNSVAKGAGCL